MTSFSWTTKRGKGKASQVIDLVLHNKLYNLIANCCSKVFSVFESLTFTFDVCVLHQWGSGLPKATSKKLASITKWSRTSKFYVCCWLVMIFVVALLVVYTCYPELKSLYFGCKRPINYACFKTRSSWSWVLDCKTSIEQAGKFWWTTLDHRANFIVKSGKCSCKRFTWLLGFEDWCVPWHATGRFGSKNGMVKLGWSTR